MTINERRYFYNKLSKEIDDYEKALLTCSEDEKRDFLIMIGELEIQLDNIIDEPIDWD